MRRVVAVELRRGVGPWTAAVVAVALVFGLLSDQRDWVGDWSGWSFYTRTLLILAGPVVVAGAAWQGGRSRRRDLADLFATSSRSHLQRTVVAWASPALGGLAAYVLVFVLAAGVTASRTSYGRPWVGMLVSGAAALLALAAVGFAVGERVPWRLTAPLLGLATYVAVAVPAYWSSGVRFLTPFMEPNGLIFTRPAAWWAAASTLVFLGAGLAVLLAVGRRLVLAGAAVLLAVAAGVPVTQAGEEAFPVDAMAEQHVCAGGAPEVCLTRRHADQLPAVERVVRAVTAGVADPPRVVEGYAYGGETGPGIRLNELYLGPTLTGGPDRESVTGDVARGLVTWPCGDGTPESGPAGFQAELELSLWLQRRAGPLPEPHPAPHGRLVEMPEPDVLALLNGYRAAAASCAEAAARRALAPLR